MPRTTPAVQALLRRALTHHQAGDLAAATAIYRDVLARVPGHPDALHLLGLVAHREGRLAEARERVGAAIAAQPDNPVYAANLGNICKDAGDAHAAMASYRRALALDPRQAGARNNLGTLLLADGQVDDAIECFRAVLAERPDHARAWHNLGLARRRGDDVAGAEAAQRRAVALDPTLDVALATLARLLQEQGRAAEAVGLLASVAGRSPGAADAHADLALAQHQAGLLAAARASYERALALRPDWLEVRCQPLRAAAEGVRLGRARPPLAARRERHRGRASRRAARPPRRAARRDARAAARRGPRERGGGRAAGARAAALRAATTPGRLRIGYLSGDFREHATAYLIAELVRDPRSRRSCEVVLLSYGPDDGSPMRQRLAAAADHFVELRAMDDDGAARRIAALGVDILVDLNGNTDNARTGIAARRPAPVQVNWLGFPGTLGDPAYDYLVADGVVVPPGDEAWYAEQVVRLPGCYQSNDRRRPRPVGGDDRASHGLPEGAIVLCSLNQSFKITRPVFTAWLRILAAVPEAVLWLLEDNAEASGALRRAAADAGVAAGRLVFAPRQPLEAHLARYRLADLAVDTFPCGSHTTASDALWMGCPLVTVAGAHVRIAGGREHRGGGRVARVRGAGPPGAGVGRGGPVSRSRAPGGGAGGGGPGGDEPALRHPALRPRPRARVPDAWPSGTRRARRRAGSTCRSGTKGCRRSRIRRAEVAEPVVLAAAGVDARFAIPL